MDDFSAYRTMCTNRLRRLERCKKTRSFCNLDDETPSSNHDNSSNVTDDEANTSDRFFVPESEGKENSAYELIKEQMNLPVIVNQFQPNV
uniref:Uncharacterized protein n=1 Tax=Heterorhabditis bacteriophora TaxID=37862 RepID=A0A1I7WH56_HETBA